MPSAKGYPLEALMEDCQHYFQETGRRISFEYTLLGEPSSHVVKHDISEGFVLNVTTFWPSHS